MGRKQAAGRASKSGPRNSGGFVLLSREAFKEKTLARVGGRCCLCEAQAVDAHHILERKLWADGGYYAENGAPLCGRCHWDAEMGKVAPEAVRAAAGISAYPSPEGLGAGRIDKWGNRYSEALGAWIEGPLGQDAGMLKALAAGGRPAPLSADLEKVAGGSGGV